MRQHDDENQNPGSDHRVVGETVDRPHKKNSETFRDEGSVDEESEYDYAMSISELLYSISSFYAIVVPGESKLLGREPSKVNCRNLPLTVFSLQYLAP